MGPPRALLDGRTHGPFVVAVGIRDFSAFTAEQGFILLPGTQLEVVDVKTERGGLCTVRLTESEEQPLVS